ncbi:MULTISPECIES: thioredoxin family protein [Candidatus Ichthyocystis]|uniref:Putative peroxidase AhpC/TSA family n=1 Tax=Candidatus Ichthyocystis hellenicum TaxID=1561003 RepID=A0A0S4LZE5_9BURK|nr:MULTISPECIES: thioredoxin family protein [Ichthyocystis]CUT16935.1 putative peroxidase AhpC/TSA family [Candidatus Ichthyocystis hellenicum]
MAMKSPVCEFGWSGPDFSLPGTDGKVWSRSEIVGTNGQLIMFICNHCPYVMSILNQLLEDISIIESHGIKVVAICSNDAKYYPEDSFENMKKMAIEKKFSFPYLHDESQEVAHAYDAVCTPDFFGFNKNNELQYRGRHSSSGKNVTTNSRRELQEAMILIAETGTGPKEQNPSMGCSIKWKN